MYTLQSLKEAWRVLKPDAVLCDIHPYNAFTPFEVATQGQRITVAALDRRAEIEGITIAQDALAIMCHEGQFTLERRGDFIVYRYWNTIEDAEVFFNGDECQIILTDDAIERSQNLLSTLPEGAQLSVQRILVIGRYRKVEKKLIQIE